MRFFTVAVVAGLSSFVSAQDVFGSLPKCAQTCFGSNFGQCAQLDFKCICGNKTLISDLSCCVFQTCSQADQDSTIKLAVSLCKANGVDVPTSASCASTASSTPAPSSSGSASGSTSTSAASGSTTSSTTGTAATSATSSGGQSSATAASGASSVKSAAAVPMATGGAGLGMAIGMAGLLVAL